jgi:hypothetical protein
MYKWFRDDGTVKPEAFEDKDASVTRHKRLSEERIWAIGRRVAKARRPDGILYGRADLKVDAIRQCGVNVIPDPIFRNLNHACIVGLATIKAERMIVARKLANASTFKRCS